MQQETTQQGGPRLLNEGLYDDLVTCMGVNLAVEVSMRVCDDWTIPRFVSNVGPKCSLLSLPPLPRPGA